MKTNFIVFILFNLFMITSCIKQSKKSNMENAIIRENKMKLTKVVMLGNSITAGTNWNKLLNRNSIVNKGIPGDKTKGFLIRINEVIELKPEYCFIMGGINDLYDDISVKSIFQNYSRIIDTLTENGITPIIQSTLYVSPKWKRHIEKNRKVAELNLLLLKLASEKNIKFIDVNKILSDGRILIGDYTTDGVHLNADGYKIWGAALEKVFDDLGL